eukprot:m.71773 g.71773  ORF g.71773 m.71773 type:complete len:172 (+) comp8737_c0_seq1:62-577(+)
MRWVWMVTTAMVVSWSQQTARATDTPTPASPSPASSIPPTDTPMLTSTLVPEITSSSTSGGGPSAPAGPIVVMNIEDRQPAAVSAQPHTILIEINRTLAPLGAERFLRLVRRSQSVGVSTATAVQLSLLNSAYRVEESYYSCVWFTINSHCTHTITSRVTFAWILLLPCWR